MAKTFTLGQLTENIRSRHMGETNKRLVEKWSRTGLLRGLEAQTREGMSVMLENQASQLLREANSLSTGGGNLVGSGDIRGFTNIAFPIVRRVFGGLVANELVSIQPMSLPSGLLFYLDYTYGNDVGGDAPMNLSATNNAATYKKGQSIYNNPTGKGIQSGSLATGGQYDLAGTGYSQVHKDDVSITITASGAYGSGTSLAVGTMCMATGTDGKLLQFDPQVTTLIDGDPGRKNDGRFQLVFVTLSTLPSATDLTQVKQIALHSGLSDYTGLKPFGEAFQGGRNILNLRRLNQLGTYTSNTGFVANPFVTTTTTNAVCLMVVSGARGDSGGTTTGGLNLSASVVLSPDLNVATGTGSTLTIPTFESNFSTSAPSPAIPEIDIKIESIAVTAVTRKLRARWSPELAQDLNAYHSLDAEVELTQILSEQIALEIDREVLNDLLTEARMVLTITGQECPVSLLTRCQVQNQSKG